MERTTGIMVRVTPSDTADRVINGPMDHYALLIRPDGATRMVHYEGVAYLVTDEKPWRWTDYAPAQTFTPGELEALSNEESWHERDLADWIKVFGARCESNFHQVARWYQVAQWYHSTD